MKTWHYVIRGSINIEDESNEEQVRFYLTEQTQLNDHSNYVEIDLEEGE